MKLRESEVKNSKSVFELFTALELKEKNTIVQGMAVGGTITLMTGGAGVGKSTVMALLLNSVSQQGFDLGPLKTEKNLLSVYATNEGLHECKNRQLAYEKKLGQNGVTNHVYHLTEDVDFNCENDVEQLIKDLLALLEKTGLRPALFVVDTINSLTDFNENSSTEVGHFLKLMRRLAEMTGFAVMLVHHKTEKSNDIRGSGAFKAGVFIWLDLYPKPKSSMTTIIEARRHKASGASILLEVNFEVFECDTKDNLGISDSVLIAESLKCPITNQHTPMSEIFSANQLTPLQYLLPL